MLPLSHRGPALRNGHANGLLRLHVKCLPRGDNMHIQNGRGRPPQNRGPLAAVARERVGTRLGHAVSDNTLEKACNLDTGITARVRARTVIFHGVPYQHRDCSDNFREAPLHEHVADQRELHLPLTPPDDQGDEVKRQL